MSSNRKGTGPTGRVVHQLNMRQKFDVCTLVQNNYAAKGQSDAEFALWATEQLGYFISHQSIATARDAFNIPSTKQTVKAAPTRLDAMERLIETLEHRVGTLEQRLEIYMKGSR